MTFENFSFSEKQINIYYTNAKNDLAKVLKYKDDNEVGFRFGYDALIKLAVTVCAHEGLRVLSRAGHHIELIDKLSIILKDESIRQYGNEMRKKRNLDFYGGGTSITRKEAMIYLDFIRKTFVSAEDFFNKKIGVNKLFGFLSFGICFFFVSCILFLASFAPANAATEFISIIDPDNGTDGTATDYTSLSAWEAAVQSDLTTSTTKVFSYSSASSTIPDGALVTGQISGATASSTHMTASTTSSQILLTNISGTFLNGEQVYVVSTGASSTYVILSNAGDSAIAVAKCRSTGGGNDGSLLLIDGWITNISNYIKIWTNPTDPYGRHDGKVNGSGYMMKSNSATTYAHNIEINENYTVVDGIKIERTSTNWSYGGAIVFNYNYNAANYCTIKNNLLYQSSGGLYGALIYQYNDTNKGFGNYYLNNIVISDSTSLEYGIEFRAAWDRAASYLYNNTVYGKYSVAGFLIYASNTSSDSYKPNIKNNYVANIGSGSDFDFLTQYNNTLANFTNNYSSTSTAGTLNGNGQISVTSMKFNNTTAGYQDLHLGVDSAAKNVGTSTSWIYASAEMTNEYDIDGTARGSAPDIGADEVPVDFTSIICENKTAGGNCASLDYQTLSQWEDKVEADLTASTTRVFGGSITGTLSENSTVNLCNGSTDTNIDGVVVATTSDQILIDGITGTSSPLITTSGYRWVDETCASPVNYWTVSGTGDALGASPRAVAEIDGSWSTGESITSSIQINGWDTDNDNLIKIYSTSLARHNGVWNDTKYRIKRTTTGNYQNILSVYEHYVLIDGLQVEYDNSAGYSGSGALSVDYISGKYASIYISNNIIKAASSTAPGSGISFGNNVYDKDLVDAYIFNNIVYDFATYGIYNYYTNKAYVYNNTVINCDIGYRGDVLTLFKNNIAQDCNDGFYNTGYSANSDFNISDIVGDAHNVTFATTSINVSFVDENGHDFHLLETDTGAKNKGVDLSATSTLSFTVDIDGGPRNVDGLSWDIGADEVATKIYRSIGNIATAISNSATVSISSSTKTATFSAGQPDNVGVGDVIQFGGAGYYDVAIINGRISSSTYSVQAWDGGVPTATTSASMNIFIAYRELDDWEDNTTADVNTGIDATQRAKVVVGSNLVASNTIMMAACYAAATVDDAEVVIDGWTTGEGNYIKVYTPYKLDEVGVSQRHSGVWDTGKYRLEITNGTQNIIIKEPYSRIDGLQIKSIATALDYHSAIFWSSSLAGTEVYISNNIFKGEYSGTARYGYGIYASEQYVGENVVSWIWNNIFLNFETSNDLNSYGIMIMNGQTANLYNNTIYNSYYGISRINSTMNAYNNIVQDCVIDYSGGAYTAAGYNISSDSTAKGANSQTNVTLADIKFYSTTAGSEDLRIQPGSIAQNAGTSSHLTNFPISQFPNFHSDIQGHKRGTFDIGADEASEYFTSRIRTAGNPDSDYTTLSGWEAANQVDLTAWNTLMFSYSVASGTLADGVSVIGETSGATASSTHTTTASGTKQILLYNIDGNFVAGERIYVVGSSVNVGNVALADIGSPAIAVAEGYNDWAATGLSDAVAINGWGVNKTNYVKVYAPEGQKHNGWTWTSTAKTTYSGFAIKVNATYSAGVWVWESYTQIEGLIVNVNDEYASEGVGVTVPDGLGNVKILDNIVFNVNGVGTNGGIVISNVSVSGNHSTIANNLVYDASGAGIKAGAYSSAWIYNNTITDSDRGIYLYGEGYYLSSILKSNLTYRNTTDFDFASYSSLINDYSVSSDGTADNVSGTNNYTNQTITFRDEANDDFRLSVNDTGAKGKGLDLSLTANASSTFTNDISGSPRNIDGQGWDIGASEALPDFVSKIRSSYATGDYNKLSTWEDAIDSDLTASTSKVFTVSDIGTYSTSTDDGAVVTFTGGATGTLLHINTSNVAYITNTQQATGNIEAGTVTVAGSGHTFVISNTGAQIGRAVAECYNDWPTGLSDSVQINNWTTGENNYVKIYTPLTERHNGIPGSGFYIKNSIGYSAVVILSEAYTKFEGIDVRNTRTDYSGDAVLVNSGGNYSIIDSCLLQTSANGDDRGVYITSIDGNGDEVKIINNVIYDSDIGILFGDWVSSRAINNTINGCVSGISRSGTNGTMPTLINNVVLGASNDYSGNWHSNSINNASDDSNPNNIPGNNSIIGVTSDDFVNASINDLHLSVDSKLIGAGTSSPSTIFTTDIDNESRGVGSSTLRSTLGKWDIGADQSPVDFYSKIRSSYATGDYNKLSTWEAAINSDLTASTSKVFTVTDLGTYATSTDDGLMITFAGGGTGRLVHINKDYLLYATGTAGTIYAGTVTVSNGHTFVISDTGIQIGRAVAECYNDWPTGLNDYLTILGWTTGINNYVKVYAPVGQRHNGVAENAGVFNGFAIKDSTNTNHSTIVVSEDYTIIDGLIVNSNAGYIWHGIDVGGYRFSKISNNIVIRGALNNFSVGVNAYLTSGNVGDGGSIFNNVVYGKNDKWAYGISGGKSYIYNNTVYNCYRGIAEPYYISLSQNNIAINNLFYDFGLGGGASWHINSNNNISSDSKAPGTNSIKNATLAQIGFLNTTSGSEDFHISKDSIAVGAGTSSPSSIFTTDIDNENRFATTSWTGPGADDSYPSWDIGADQTATEFVSRIRTSSGHPDADFTTLSAWETAVQADLTATTTRVFYYYPNSATGTIPNGASVVACRDALQCVSTGAIASSTYRTATSSSHQILLTNIVGTFLAGDKLYIQGGATTSNYVILASEGLAVIAVAEAYNDWPSGLSNYVSIDGWTTDVNNYIKIYAPEGERHVGVMGSGFFLTVNYTYVIQAGEMYTKFVGLEMRNFANSVIYGNSTTNSRYQTVDSCILYSLSGSAYNYSHDYSKVINNIIIGETGSINGLYDGYGDIDVEYINNTITGFTNGINAANNSIKMQNNVVYNCANDYVNFLAHASSSNNASDALDISGIPGVNAMVGITSADFVDVNSGYYHPSAGSKLRDAGTYDSYTGFQYDITGHPRGVSGWDIGAFEGAREFVSSVMQSGGDYASLSAWEDAVEVDLTASGTIVYSGSITGSLNAGDVLTLVRAGATSTVTGVVVATTSGQILLRDVAETPKLGVSTGWAVDAGDVWWKNAGNYWTVSGSGDDLGRSAIAVAKIDGAWSVADGNKLVIDGWNTGPGNYIKVYTTETARHLGKWSDNDYRIEVSADDVIDIHEDNVRIDGLQVSMTGVKSYEYGILHENSNITLSNNIIRNAGSGERYGIRSDTATSRGLKYFNNIIYDFTSTNSLGVWIYSADDTLFYNNTIYNCYGGIGATIDAVLAKNNIVMVTSGVAYDNNGFVAGSSYNISSDASIGVDADMTNYTSNAMVNFVSTTTKDFHISPADIAANNKGVNLTYDPYLPFTTDIDGEARGTTWDIGADQNNTINVGGETANPVIGEEVDLTNGLVGYWDFNEGSGSVVKDKSGNGNDGTWSGTGAHWAGKGWNGNGGKYNGSDDSVNVGSNAVLDNITESSICAWVNPNSWGENLVGNIYAKYNGTSNFSFRVDSDGAYNDNTIYFFVDYATTNLAVVAESNFLVLNKWQFVCVVWDGTVNANGAKLYRDGKETTSYNYISNGSGDRVTDAGGNAYLGNSDGSRTFDGGLDEVRIYNRALNQTEIATLYNKGLPSAEWHFRNDYKDRGAVCGQGVCKNLTAGGTGNKFGAGFLEQSTTALQLSGSGYASLADDSYFDIASTADFSLIATIKTSDTASTTIISKRTNSAVGSAGYLLGLDYGAGDGIPYFEISDGTHEFSVQASQSISDNQWHTVIVVVDDDLQAGNKIYIDGIDKTGTRTGTVADVYDISNSIALNIGRNNDNSGLFTGSIDRIALFHHALTRADMLRENAGGTEVNVGATEKTPSQNAIWDPFGGAAPVAWWRFDEMSGTTVKDYASSTLDGTWNGTGNHFVKGKKGMGGNFNGVDDYVEVLDKPSLRVERDDFTVSVYINTNLVPETNDTFLEKVNGSGEGIRLWKDAMGYGFSLKSSSDALATIHGSISTIGEWVYLTGTYDYGSKVMKYYENGVYKSTYTKTENPGSSIGNNLMIGKDSDFGRNFFGMIDDVKIYDYVRTPAQIAWDYNGGKPIAHWKFDEASSGSADGDTIRDSSGNGYNGTGVDGANNTGLTWTSGKRGNAIDFDGVDDYVDCGTVSGMSTNSGTVSLWFALQSVPGSSGFLFSHGPGTGDRIYIDVTSGKIVRAQLGDNIGFTSSNYAVALNEWSHVLITWNGSTWDMYINGIEKISNISYSGVDGFSSIHVGNFTSNGFYVDSIIDDVRIYNYTLTADQVKEVYNGGNVYFGE